MSFTSDQLVTAKPLAGFTESLRRFPSPAAEVFAQTKLTCTVSFGDRGSMHMFLDVAESELCFGHVTYR